jgi:hypothetical protein
LVQTTLLTLGIAIILALVAALAGPAMIDWQEHKAEIQEQARQIVGVPVKVGGTIDVRLLPTPSLTLGDVEIGPAESTRKVSARGLSMELSLGALMRGEIRANQVTLDRPEVRVWLDKSGALQMPGLALKFDADQFAIERLTVTDGLLHFSDVASGAKLDLEGLNVSGEAGSLIGPFKLEGTFTVGGEQYGYRFSGSRRDDSGGLKIRLGIAADERAFNFDSEGTVRLDDGSPRFEGVAALSPTAGSKDRNGRVTLIKEPWKISSRVKASTSSVQLEKMEMSYGQEARVIRANGEATLKLGSEPHLTSTLSTRQIDFDRVLPGGEQKRSPFETIKLLVDKLAEAPKPPLPVHLTFNVDSLMAGGATVSSLHSVVETAADGWNLDRFDMRAPGATEVLDRGAKRAGPAVVRSDARRR